MKYTNTHIIAAMDKFNVDARSFRFACTKAACDARTTAIRCLHSEGLSYGAIARMVGLSNGSSARDSMKRVLTP